MNQHVEDCKEHDNCHAVVCKDGTKTLWVSHMDASIDVEPRLNPDLPDCTDKRKGKNGTIRCDVPYKPEALEAMGMTQEDAAKRAAELADKGVRTVDEMAKRPGLSLAAINKHRKKS